MFSRQRLCRLFRDMGLAIIGIAALVWAVLLYRGPRSASERPRLRITAGSARGLRHSFAEQLATRAAEQGVRIEVRKTSGSEQALDAVDSGELDWRWSKAAWRSANVATYGRWRRFTRSRCTSW